MTRKVRCGLIAAVSAAAFFVACSSATAAVFLNGAPISLTATARNPTLIESTGSTFQINCSGAQIRGTVLSDGTGTITAGNASFATCSIVGLGTIPIINTGTWTIRTEFLLDGGRIVGAQATLTMPPGSAQISFGGCSFELVGTLVSLQSVTPAAPPALVGISALPFGSLALTLTVANASNCGGTGIANGDLARVNAGFTLSTQLTGTLVP